MRPTFTLIGIAIFSFTILFSLSGNSLYAQQGCVVNNDDSYLVDENSSIFLSNLTANDFCQSGNPDPCQIQIQNPPSNGSLNLSCGVTYTPNTNYNGADNFTYKLSPTGNSANVSITVNPVNTPPVAVDDMVEIAKNIPYVINVLANDYDFDSNLSPCDVSLITQPSNGTTLLYPAPSCQLYYIPTYDFCGSDAFQYQICDPQGACATATVYITIKCNQPPQAVNDIQSTPPNTTVTLNLTANDSDPEDGTLNPCNASIFSTPANGMASLNSCSFSYTPNNNFCGTDSFQYQVCDSGGECSTAWAIINTICQNSPPTVVGDSISTNINTPIVFDPTSNDSDPEDGVLDPCNATIITQPSNGTISISACQFTYTPSTDFCGEDDFVYQACDSQGSCSNAFVVIKVNCKQINLKVFLEGPFNANGMMDDQVRANNSLPSTEPYTDLGYNRAAAQGGETISNPNLLLIDDNTAIVDWILIEIRDQLSPQNIITTKAALVRRDGQVVDIEGNFPIEIEGTPASFIVAIRHRNHLSTIDETTICDDNCSLDFTTKSNAPGQVLLSDGIHYGLEQGSANGDDIVNAQDRSEAWNARNFNGYHLADVNMDNIVNAADRSITWNKRNQSIALPE